MASRKEEVDSCLARAKVISAAITETVHNNEDIIRTASWMNRKLAGSLSGYGFLTTVYGAVSNEKLESIRDDEFQKLILPFRAAVTEGSTYIDLARRTFDAKANFVVFAGTCSASSATVYTSTGDSAANLMMLAPAVGIPKDTMDAAMQRLLQTTKVDEDIEYIKTQLSSIRPDVSTDFQRFLTTYYSEADTTTKYIELIGLRTLIYFRFVFAFAESAGLSSSTRAQQTRYFLCGRNPTTDKPTEDVLNLSKDLLDELSDQDPTGQSIKTGRVTPTYVELIFRKAITIFSALLRQRELVFRP